MARDGGAKVVNPELTAQAFAKAVRDGDIVNLRLLFSPFSPARPDSTERFETEKYAYLLPDEKLGPEDDLQAVFGPARWAEILRHIEKELAAKRPARIPWDLVLRLADNAVRQGKYTSAAQAYEMLRIRPRMQDEFYKQADAALDAGDVPRAVRGYVIATGLNYNYAAFPEPLPSVPDFQNRALMLHGEYPDSSEKCVGMQEPQAFLRTAVAYLLMDPQAAARLEARPFETQVAFLKELVSQRDPKWPEFVARCRTALDLEADLRKRLEEHMGDRVMLASDVAEEIAREFGDEPLKIPAELLGRAIPNGEWWQYLKDLAYEHPAAALVVARQSVGHIEILVPRYRADSPVIAALGLAAQPAAAVPT